MQFLPKKFGTWSVPGQTQTSGTAITQGIPPYMAGAGSSNVLYKLDGNGKPLWRTDVQTIVRRFGITAGSTAHICYFMRALNYTTVNGAVAANTTSIVVKADPGIYSTNYKYPSLLSTGTAAVADNGIANTDYFAVQLVDGTWFFDKVSAWNNGTKTITTTTTIPNITGGGIADGTVLFFFGQQTDKDPATGFGHPSFNPNVSAYTEFGDPAGDGIVTTLRGGDPMYFLDANATAADTLAYIAGVYGAY